MIFQLKYKTMNYDLYFEESKGKLNRLIFDTQMINTFLECYGYSERFDKLKVKPGCEHAKNAILMDAFRLMVLYEMGGVYIDADVTFTDKINELEQDLFYKFGDRSVIVRTNSLYFIKGVKDSRFIEHLLWRYLSADALDYDVKMLKGWKLSDFASEVAIVEPEFLNKYFIHDKVTTK